METLSIRSNRLKSTKLEMRSRGKTSPKNLLGSDVFNDKVTVSDETYQSRIKDEVKQCNGISKRLVKNQITEKEEFNSSRKSWRRSETPPLS